MRLTFRDIKGSPLTAPEGDANIRALNIGNRPDLIALGDGTDSSHFSSADGTAGAQAILGGLTQGGLLELLTGTYDITSPILVTTHSTSFQGRGASNNLDPNGEADGTAGTKLLVTTTGMVLGTGGSNPRIFNNEFTRFGLVGKGSDPLTIAAGSVGLEIAGRLDQALFRDLNFNKLGDAIRISQRLNGGNLDAPNFSRNIVLNCVRWLVDVSQLPSYFGLVTDSCPSDLDGAAILLNNPLNEGWIYMGLQEVRANRRGVDEAANVIGGRDHIFVGNTVRDPGYFSRAGTRVRSDGTAWRTHYGLVLGNVYRGAQQGYGLAIYGSYNQIGPNAYSDNQKKLLLASGANDNTITEPSLKLGEYDDYGSRNIINGFARNVGDPRTEGDWLNHAVPEGTHLEDTKNGVLYLYHSAFTGGRFALSTAAAGTAPAAGSGNAQAGSGTSKYVLTSGYSLSDSDTTKLNITGNWNTNNASIFYGGFALLTGSDSGYVEFSAQTTAATAVLRFKAPYITDFGVAVVSVTNSAGVTTSYDQSQHSDNGSNQVSAVRADIPLAASDTYKIRVYKKAGQASSAQVCFDQVDMV